jgi:PAS domain S-box-containing protein
MSDTVPDTAPRGAATFGEAAPPAQPAGEPRFLFWWVAIVGVLLTLGAVGVLTYLRGEIREQNLLTALDDAENFARSVTQFRNFYSAEIVPRASASGMEITHGYRHVPNALPLPATFTLDFGAFLAAQQGGTSVRLFSELPFPWRLAEREALDDFQRAALAYLRARPDESFHRVELIDGARVLRYAVADRLLDSCVACHNSYPGSPKVDWRVGDVRGVLEVRRPIAASEARLSAGLDNAFLLSFLVVAGGMALMWLSVRGFRRALRESRAQAALTRDANLKLQSEITARVDIEQQLTQSRERMSLALKGANDGWWDWDLERDAVYCSPRWWEMLGYPPEETPINRERLRGFIDADEQPAIERQFNRALDSDAEGYQIEFHMRHRDGHWVPVLSRGFILRDAAGRAVRISGSNTDLTVRKRDEAVLRFNEAKMRAIFDGVLEGVIVIDQQGIIVQANRLAAEMFGYPLEALIGGNVNRLMPPEDATRHDGYLRRYIESGKASIIGSGRVAEGLRANGARFPIHLAVNEVRVGEERIFVGIVTDITEQVARERELRDTRDAALEAARLKSEFLANMSHEIRTPMNGVLGMAGLLMDTPLDAEQRDTVRTLQLSAEALLTVINDILDHSKIEAGKLELSPCDFDPVRVVEEVIDLHAVRVAEKNLQFAYCCVVLVPRWVRADASRFRQVLNNLIGNAIKFTPSGHVQVLLEGDPEGTSLRVSVRDSGIGIAADKLRQLFQPFTQVDGSATRRFGGTGLGLAISRQLVQLMGGEISVESEPEVGSTFHFSIALQTPLQPPPERPNLAGRRVLYCGDNDPLISQLRGWSLRVEYCREIALVQDRVVAGRFELLLLDEDLANADTLASLAAACRQRAGADLTIALLVARRAGAHAIRGLPRLFKPLREQDLVGALHAAEAPRASLLSASGSPVETSLASLAGKRVLVAEDNQVNQKLVSALLSKHGLSFDIVDNGAAVLEKMRETAYDLVLMDCQMPVIDGFETARRWRASEVTSGRGHVPVIAFTANAMQGDRDRCLAAGMDDYLSKPVSHDKLAAMLRKWLVAPPRGEVNPP